MLTSIALIISGITSCVCIIIAVRQTRFANSTDKYCEHVIADRDRLVLERGSQSIRLVNAEHTLKKVRELVITDDPKSDGEG